MGGTGAIGVNPEQMFAGGYSACFMGAISAVAGKTGAKVPADASINGEVGFGPIATGFCINAHLKISLPGMSIDEAKKLVEAAHQVCPYSNATRGNITVNFTITV